MTKANVKWMALVAVLAGAPALQASFVGITCYGEYNNETCVNANVSTIVPNGSTTFTFDGQFTGSLVGGKPTLGTYAAMAVDDSNGVPVMSPFMSVYSNMTFTDTVTAAPAPSYAFNLSLHTINNAGYFDGFHDAYTALTLLVNAYDSGNGFLWSSGAISRTVRVTGDSTTPVVWESPLGFPNANVAGMSITVSMTSLVFYSNFLNLANSTHVAASVDALHTVSLQSIQATNGSGGVLPGTFNSSSGANYSASSAVPEPASWLLAAAGLAIVAGRKRFQRS
jgi:hypothetical protein